MSITTHGYLPIETDNGVGFTRVAMDDMTPDGCLAKATCLPLTGK